MIIVHITALAGRQEKRDGAMVFIMGLSGLAGVVLGIACRDPYLLAGGAFFALLAELMKINYRLDK